MTNHTRIALDPKELQGHPLRVGLSMTAQVEVRDTSGPLIADQVRNQPLPSQPSLGEDPEVEAHINRIVAANAGNAQLAAARAIDTAGMP